MQKLGRLKPFAALESQVGISHLRMDNSLMPISIRYGLFQKALADARQEKRLTQADVAARLGKPQSFVSKYESGERRLDVIEFLEVCEALTVSSYSILKKVRPQSD